LVFTRTLVGVVIVDALCWYNHVLVNYLRSCCGCHPLVRQMTRV